MWFRLPQRARAWLARPRSRPLPPHPHASPRPRAPQAAKAAEAKAKTDAASAAESARSALRAAAASLEKSLRAALVSIKKACGGDEAKAATAFKTLQALVGAGAGLWASWSWFVFPTGPLLSVLLFIPTDISFFLPRFFLFLSRPAPDPRCPPR